jgi:hypothetical protein
VTAPSSQDAALRARFDQVSDACREAFAAGDEPRARELLAEFFTLQMSYLQGTVGRVLHARFAQEKADVVMYIAERLIGSLRRGRPLHWHMLWAIYNNCIVDYGRRRDVVRDPAGAPAGGIGQQVQAGTQIHGDPSSADPLAAAERADLTDRVQQMLADLAQRPEGIRHPERMCRVIDYRLGGVENTAEIAALLDVAEGTLRREWNEFRKWAIAAYPDLREYLPVVDAGEVQA